MEFNTNFVQSKSGLIVYISPDDVKDYKLNRNKFSKIISHKVKEINKEFALNEVEGIAIVHICLDPKIPHIVQFDMIKGIGENIYAAYSAKDIPYLLYQTHFFTSINKLMIHRLKRIMCFPEFIGQIHHTKRAVLNSVIKDKF